MIPLEINWRRQNVDVLGETPLLWTLRDELGLTGSKFGCGMALCGACTVHVDGQPVRSCITPVSSVTNKKIVTIEAVGGDPIGNAQRDLRGDGQANQEPADPRSAEGIARVVGGKRMGRRRLAAPHVRSIG